MNFYTCISVVPNINIGPNIVLMVYSFSGCKFSSVAKKEIRQVKNLKQTVIFSWYNGTKRSVINPKIIYLEFFWSKHVK